METQRLDSDRGIRVLIYDGQDGVPVIEIDTDPERIPEGHDGAGRTTGCAIRVYVNDDSVFVGQAYEVGGAGKGGA